MTKESTDAKPRYIPMPNGKRYALLLSLDQVPHAELKARERNRFLRTVEAIDFSEQVRREQTKRERKARLATRAVELAKTPDDIWDAGDKLDAIEAELQKWEAIIEVVELSKETCETLAEFSSKSPLLGIGVRLLQPFINMIGDAAEAKEGSEYLVHPNGNGKTEAFTEPDLASDQG